MLRKRKNRRYNEETNDDDGERKFNLAEQIRCERFDQKDKHLQELPGDAVTLRFIQKNGFERPILVVEPEGLDLRVPPKNFLVRDVRNCVGHQRIIDVMDVKTQKNIEMSMKDWCKYYESKSRDRLLNVISLEFSHTKLDELVESPMIVRLLDWVDLVWPKFLKESQTESTNSIDKMKYPKVQKYCLMSVKGSYTDFHIDFGGTSVWYHVLRGRKIFWMVPPTELSLQTFEEWTLSGQQQDVFFGDTVEECFRVEICAGNTFFIPSGWIHAVYTVEDSLVFGGNFLHSFGMENQLKVSRIEDAIKVPIKFRYPFYTEILWYVVQHYVYCLTGKDHLHRPDKETSVSTPKEKRLKSEIVDDSVSKNAEIGDEDEATDCEYEESDIKKKNASSSSKRVKGKSGKKASKKQRKPITDDESTDIDSGSEELAKAKPTTNTCRMTKNSLLRLQYEIDEQISPNKLAKTAKCDTPSKNSPKKNEESSPAATQAQSTTSPINQQTKLNLAELMLSNESKLNGWSGSNGQTMWLNPNTDSSESMKIHITKYELNGLKVMVKYLSKLSGAKKNLPNLIRNSRALLDDCRKLIAEHENDDPQMAVTGKTITTDLLKPKPTDMNELIGQFFKPTENVDDDKEKIAQQTAFSNSFIKAKFDSSNSQKFKFGLSESVLKDEKKPSASINNNNNNDSNESTSKSPQKETKCLSPYKKFSNAPNSSSSSPPPRPKSPPTRPLSNNQYTSKTKGNINLPLPGSFADLIAATSTEDKVFDITMRPTSLFGAKDLASSKPKHSTSPTKVGTVGTVTNQTTSKKSINVSPDISPISKPANINTSAGASVVKEFPSKTISPEPPKTNLPKRFINPAMRPALNKEKLIFASAPYISPVHTTDPSRSAHSYSNWQTPAPHNPPIYSSAPPRYVHSSTVPSNIQPPYTPDPRPINQALHMTPTQIRQPSRNETNKQQSEVSVQAVDIKKQLPVEKSTQQQQQYLTGDKEHKSVIVSPSQHQPKQSNQINPLKIEQIPCGNSNIVVEDAVKFVANAAKPFIAGSVSMSNVLNDEPKLKKPTSAKPRGPPKKSKEARQAIVTEPHIEPATRVIEAGPSNSVPGTQVTGAKIKSRRPKKMKEEAYISTTPASINSAPMSTSHQSVICSLIPPAISTAAGKANPQSYLISSPLLFNSMPNFSGAQMQQPPGGPLPMITTTMSQPLAGLPLQQGARIVWATQPGRLTAPMANLNIPGGVRPLYVPRQPATTIKSQHDNAALLSLATTALSAAPMATNPTLSSLAPGGLNPQAIRVSSASAQPGMFANQQLLKPIFQGMPMATHYLTRPTSAPRPTGQLVFARLPNQGQPRYLITQPGFMQQRFPSPHIPTSQPLSTALPFATLRPPTDPTKTMKTKKVKTS